MKWKTLKLNKLCDISIGKTPSRNSIKYWDKNKKTKNIWLSISDLAQSKNRLISDSKEYVSDEGAKLFKYVPKGTLLMSFKLTIGRLAIAGCDLRTNEAIAAFKILNEKILNRDYLYYFLSSLNWTKIGGGHVKIKGNTLNKAILKELEIVVPPIAEQERIVAALNVAFVEIDRAIQITKKTMNEVKIFFSTAIDEKTSPKAGWKKYKVSDLGLVQTGATPKTANKKNYGKDFPFIKPPNFNKNGTINIEDEGLSKKGITLSRIAKANSVLMVCIGATIGKVAVNHKDVCFNQQINSVTPKDKYDSELVYWQMRGKRFQAEVRKKAGQTTLPIINKSNWQNIDIFLPENISEQNDIKNKLRRLNNETDNYYNINMMKIEKLNSLKSVLLKQKLQIR